LIDVIQVELFSYRIAGIGNPSPSKSHYYNIWIKCSPVAIEDTRLNIYSITIWVHREYTHVNKCWPFSYRNSVRNSKSHQVLANYAEYQFPSERFVIWHPASHRSSILSCLIDCFCSSWALLI